MTKTNKTPQKKVIKGCSGYKVWTDYGYDYDCNEDPEKIPDCTYCPYGPYQNLDDAEGVGDDEDTERKGGA